MTFATILFSNLDVCFVIIGAFDMSIFGPGKHYYSIVLDSEWPPNSAELLVNVIDSNY